MSFLSKLALYALLSAFVVVNAKAQEPEAFRGIWCTDATSIEKVVTLGTKLGGAQEGIIAVNEEVEGSCFFGSIIGIRQERGKTIQSPDGLLDIVAWKVLKVVIIADFKTQRLIPANLEVELTRYTLEGSKARGV